MCKLTSGKIWPTYCRWLVFDMERFWHLVWANLTSCNFSLFFFLILLYIFQIYRVFVNKVLQGFIIYKWPWYIIAPIMASRLVFQPQGGHKEAMLSWRIPLLGAKVLEKWTGSQPLSGLFFRIVILENQIISFSI